MNEVVKSDALKQMMKDNIFVRIAVNSFDKKMKTADQMSELCALYFAMGWINEEEVTEIMAYVTEVSMQVA